MSAPRIGVTGMWSNRVHGLRFDGNAAAVQVLRSIVRAGGEPLTLFAESPDDPVERVRPLDGIVIPGGADLKPETYGARPHPETRPADYGLQDEFEASILSAAIAEGKPVLAICRGFQLLNALHAGTLNQHVGDESNPHRNSVHGIDVLAGSRLSAVLGSEPIAVSSYHHQAVDRLGRDLLATAVAPDGVVEAVELPGASVIAIQWHPEDSAENDARQQALFDWLVGEAGRRASR